MAKKAVFYIAYLVKCLFFRLLLGNNPQIIEACDGYTEFGATAIDPCSFEDFTIQAPLDNLGAGRSETDILVAGAHTAGDASIAIDGFSANQTGSLKVGDIIKFANHSKIYMVQSDIDSDSGGALTVLISPNLVAALADNEAVTVNKPSYTVYLANNEIMYVTDASGFYSISFDVREAIT